ncbi:DUF2599 domain-containing protein [Arthrobacter sp. 2YAF22_2]|nr:DUF2599 domain-containing protein [Arthrobacter sp.]
MTLRRKITSLTVGAIGFALLLGQAGPAGAAPDDNALRAIAAVSPNVQSLGKQGIRDKKVEVPTDSSGVVKITGQKGQSLSIGLPFAEKSATARPIGNGVVSYDNGNGSATVPIPQDDNSVAIHTIIESSAAPSRYQYRVDIPAGAAMKPNEDGSVAISRADGTFFGGFAKPWAKDAAGVALPTHYEVQGRQLVQVVDHSSPTVKYPVVADPWAGVDLIDGLPWITYASQGGVVNLNPTGWGRFYNGFATHNAHVDELRTKLGRIGWNLTGTIQEQYLCHVVGNVFEPGTYNLESWRPWMYWGDQLNLTYRCNP